MELGADGAAGTADFDEFLAALTTPPRGQGGSWAAMMPGLPGAEAEEALGAWAELPAVRACKRGGAALRCLDATHANGCMRCTPPPAEGAEAAHELTGLDGKKNGEKRRAAVAP
jgi:hypothetical protein